jgi:cyclopropane-fatty-acyl-phospholipid synthase
VTFSDRIARLIVLGLLSHMKAGQLTLVEGDQRRVYGTGAPKATVVIRSPKAWRALLRGSLGLAESHIEGWWESPDLTALVRVAARNVEKLDSLRRVIAPVWRPVQTAYAVIRANTRRRSKRQIAAHYDLGNDLFEQMLGSSMMYSSAYFEHPGMTLEQAAEAKLERICRKLDIGPDDHVLEIGTGWGGFAIYAAQTRGCRVTTTTISSEQHDYAQAAIRNADVGDLVTVVLEDYRDLTGTYDKLVSIEMIEAVGWRHFPVYFERCSELLTADGAMLLQAIVIDDRAYEVEKAGRSFMSRLIFPGGCLPSMEVIARELSARTDMRMTDLHDLTRDYAETIRRWRQNYLAGADRLAGRGYDERFRRMWLLYLSYCEAGFAERRISDVQLVLAKPQHHEAEEPAELHSVAV